MSAGIERERRFLVDGRGEKPWRENSDKVEIQQHYIDSTKVFLDTTYLMYGDIQVAELTNDEIETFLKSEVWVFRLRSWNEDYIITGKSRITSDSAYELERQIDEEQARKILAAGAYPMVSKTRYIHMVEERFRWEIDEFEGDLAGLILAEIEYNENETITHIPEWCGIELTHLKGWSNASLAKMISSPST
jgi:adenylate cyclase